MYKFLLERFGAKAAYAGTVAWYVALIVLVVLAFTGPATEFRYGNM